MAETEQQSQPDTYIAHTGTMPGHWAKAKTTREAAAALKKIAGAQFLRDNGYKVFRCHPDTTVGELGQFRWFPSRGGYNPVCVLDLTQGRK